MRMTGTRTVIVSMLLVLGCINTARTQQLRLAFEEIAQTADLIFIGTAASQSARMNEPRTMIFTDVVFGDVVIVSAAARSVQRDSSAVHLVYAGGKAGEAAVRVSDMPAFTDGHRYLIFMFDDGKTYANPIVGAYQGQFETVNDAVSRETFVLTSGGKAILEAGRHGIVAGERRVAFIKSGTPVYEEQQEAFPSNTMTQLPTPIEPSTSVEVGGKYTAATAAPMRLDGFIDYIKNTALRSPLKVRDLRREGQGHFYRMNGDKIERHEIELSTLSRPKQLLPDGNPGIDGLRKPPGAGTAARSTTSLPSPGIESPLGGALGTCGYRVLPLVMEEEAASSWSYGIDNSSMSTWNDFMIIYYVTDHVSGYGYNGKNEFCGWVDNNTLYWTYGFTWGGALAVTVYWLGSGQPDCGKIVESDIAWNPAYSWTDDASYALGNHDVILLRPVVNHELGHTWGYQDVPESYDYDLPTVMQAYYFDMVEDGRGIHYPDAFFLRRHYQSQTSIIDIKDVGVESYYAYNGLKNSTPDTSVYYPGQKIKLSKVTMENMSNSPVANFTIRFYLSSNRTISASDYYLGGTGWSTFPAEYQFVGTYTCTIPPTVPPGTYYPGATVTTTDTDTYGPNNAVSFFDSITIKASPTITASAGAGGTISPSGTVTVLYGKDQSFAITPDTGYHVVSVVVDGSPAGAETTHTFTGVTSDHTIAASFAINTYTISGSVHTARGEHVYGVVMNGLPGKPTTGETGSYTATVNYDWSGKVEPSKTGLAFTPPGAVYHHVKSNQVTNYEASVQTFSVSGHVRLAGGEGVGGVVLSGLPRSAATDTNGYYLGTVNYGWSDTVTPVKAGFTFSPPATIYAAVTSSQTTDYTGTAPGVSVAGIDLAPVFAPGSPCPVIGLSFSSITGIPAIDGIVVGRSGTVVNADIPEAKLFADNNKNGIVDGGDVQLGTTQPFSSNQAAFSGLNYPPSTSANVLVVYTIDALANPAHSAGASIQPGDITPGGGTAITFSGISTASYALPIQLASFNGTAVKTQEVRIAWVTVAEVNTYGFYVERQKDTTGAFSAVSGLIPGHGSTLETHQYGWTDSAVAPGLYQYRLREVDLNGAVSYSSRIRIYVSGLTGLSCVGGPPAAFELHQNYPNPFNPSTSVRFSVPVAGIVTLIVYNTLGQEVKRLIEGAEVFPGIFEATWDGRDGNANPVPSGLYFYRIVAVPGGGDPLTDVRKMILLK